MGPLGGGVHRRHARPAPENRRQRRLPPAAGSHLQPRQPQATSIPTTMPVPRCDLPDVAWVSARDGSRAPGDLEDQAARYHPARHELTINADFRAITDLTAHWGPRYRGIPDAQRVTDGHGREWCEQILVEVVLAARKLELGPRAARRATPPASFTAACYRATSCMQRFRSASARSLERPGRRRRIVTGLEDSRPSTWSCRRGIAQTHERGGQAGWIRPSNHRLGAKRTRAVAARSRRGRMLRQRATQRLRREQPACRRAPRPRGRSTTSIPAQFQFRSRTPVGILDGPEPRRGARARARAHPSDPGASAPAVRGRASVPALSLLGASGAILCPRAIRGHYSPVLAGFCSRQGHRYQWRSCHRKCRICRQKVYKRP
jgi:hypothetical protein